MKKKNLIVFDIDDTLTKSEFQHQKSYLDTMIHFGILEINQDWETYQNVTDSYILKENYEANFKQAFDISFIPDFEKKMLSSILELPEAKPIEGANEIVDFFLKETDYAICFATGSLLEPAFVKLSQAKINFVPELVEASNTLYTRESIVKSAIKKAENYFQVATFENIISVGDGIWDLKTANNLEIHFLGIGDKSLSSFQKENIKSHISNWNDFDFQKTQTELGIKP
ncbi:HAD family hydrolase [Pseudotenacibaculum sp. MALMAid0570]|uniref:HAD family hydrolase n=1 Tax=Pseudotenacibaculum sp. MALMAid0570 TaxID=3143938 RepID=UPI0032DFEE1E